MNYYRCCGGSEKVTIDGKKVKDKLELNTNLEGVSVSTLPYKFYYGSAVVLNNEIHILGGSSGSTKHYKIPKLLYAAY
jgi:hypothetical protein